MNKIGTTKAESRVSCFNISQHNTSVFKDLYMHQTLLVLIKKGFKRVNPDSKSSLNAQPGELLVFPSGQFITIENRVISGTNYSALGISYPNEVVNEVFSPRTRKKASNVVHIESCPQGLIDSINKMISIQCDETTPDHIIEYKSIEPLIWLKSMGYEFPVIEQRDLECKIRDLIVADTSKHWRSEEVAKTFAMSEATMRRHLRKKRTSFSAILQNVRLEKGLTLLQTSNLPITEIALDCGFSTPSHFSQAFKDRFNLRPSDVKS